MVEKFQGRMSNQRGFTLVELLAVIVILGIIAAIAVPSVGGLLANTKSDGDKANEDMFIEAGRLADLGDDFQELTDDITGITLKQLESKGYLESIPKNPDNNGNYKKKYYVTYDDDGTGYEFVREIANKKDKEDKD